MDASVTGPSKSIPFLSAAIHAGSCFCTGSALGCRLMVFEEERVGPIFQGRGCLGFRPSSSCKHLGLAQSIVPAGTSFGKAGVYPARKALSASPFAA